MGARELVDLYAERQQAEAEINAIIRKVAEDMYAAGLGWHEDAIRRFCSPPIGSVLRSASSLATWIANFTGFPRYSARRAKRRARKRRSRK